MSKLYFEDLITRNEIKVTIDDYTAYYFEDKFMNTWLGNAVVYKGDQFLAHYTLTKPYTEEDLKTLIMRYIEKDEAKNKW